MSDETTEIEITEEELEALQEVLEHETGLDVWGPKSLRFFGPKTRTLLLAGQINEETANALSSQAQELNFRDAEAPIYIQINCPGGSVVDAFAIYDMLKCLSNPIVTIVNGGCFSAAMLVACAGDERIVTPNSMYFYHQPTMAEVIIDSLESLDESRRFYEWSKHNTDRVMREAIGMSEEDWQTHLGDSSGKYFGAEKAIKYGFATAKLEFAKKPEIKLATEEECES